MSTGRGWHLDKTVNLPLIFTVLAGLSGEAAATIWWGSSINTRVASIEEHNLQQDAIVAKIQSDASNDRDRLRDLATAADVRSARLEERSTAMDNTLNRLETKMDKLIDNGRTSRPR